MKTYTQHPNIAIPDFLQAEPWQDASWKNDVCAKSLLEFNPGDDHECLRVWVAEDNPADREYPDGPKFILEHVRTEDEHTNGEALELYRGDDAENVRVLIETFLAAAAPQIALGRAQAAQVAYWDALADLEAALGVTIDDAPELAGYDVESLRAEFADTEEFPAQQL